MYSKTKSHVKINGQVTDHYEEKLGVAQDLFVQFLSDLRGYLDKSCGIHLKDQDLLQHLLRADDLVLLSSSAKIPTNTARQPITT